MSLDCASQSLAERHDASGHGSPCHASRARLEAKRAQANSRDGQYIFFVLKEKEKHLIELF